MNRTIFLTLLMLPLATVPLTRVMAADDQKPLVDYVKNLQVAEDILKPQAKQLVITRDPFKPIITPASKLARGPLGKIATASAVEDNLNDVKVVGIVRLGEEYRAYIMIGKITRVVKIQDTIRKYTITDIDMNQIVLKSGHKEIIKKRGKL